MIKEAEEGPVKESHEGPVSNMKDGAQVVEGSVQEQNGTTGSKSQSFPSLSNTVLRQLGALMEEVKQKDASQREGNQSSEKEIENKFTSLMIAFKTDELTLERRLELQQRLRDQAEANLGTELSKLKAAVELLSPLCTDSEKIELLEKVGEQMDALHKSTNRVSTTAEMYGAVQQENRLSKAVDIVMRHVENMKQAYDKEKTEHEEMRKILTDNKISPSVLIKLQNSKRRASIATVSQAHSSSDPNLPGESRRDLRARVGSLPRKLSSIIMESEQEDPKDVGSSSNSGSSSPISGPISQPRESVDPVTSGTQPPSQPMLRKTHSTVSQDRTSSQSLDTESDEEVAQEPEELTFTAHPGPQSDSSHLSLKIYQDSIQTTWLHKLNESLHQWIGPMDQLLVHLRHCVAVMLLLAALAVFIHTCFVS